MNRLETFETDKEDIIILNNLKFKTYKGKCYETINIGIVKLEGVEINCFVTGCPAQFFKFEVNVNNDENKNKYIFETGSGSFKQYWSILYPIFKNLGKNMIDIIEKERIKK